MKDQRNRNFTAPILILCFFAATLSTFCLVRSTFTPEPPEGPGLEPESPPVLVPVADWTSPVSDITSEEFENLPEKTPDQPIGLLNFDELTPAHKLLSVDGEYYLDQLKSDQPDRVLSLTQTGVTALSRAMITKLNQVKDGAYFAANLQDFLSQNDHVHISNEVSFTDSCPGGTNTARLCSDWRMLDTITALSVDIIELTGNHNNDYGASANLATLEKYESLNLKTFGGGKNEDAAKQPLRLEDKNTKITLLGYNNSTSTKENGQGATKTSPGANIYNEETAKNDIKTAKQNGDFVIVDLQFFECYSYPEEGTEMPACDAPITNQEDFFKHLIDLGADMVVGTQAHQPQTYELYKGKPIFYGLGNLFFDQTYWPGTTRSLILTHYFLDGQYLQTRISPTVYDTTYQTRLMTEKESNAFLTRLAPRSNPRDENTDNNPEATE